MLGGGGGEGGGGGGIEKSRSAVLRALVSGRAVEKYAGTLCVCVRVRACVGMLVCVCTCVCVRALVYGRAVEK